MPKRAYLFEVKAIQRFVFEGGKLKDMIGASEIVAGLCRSDANDLLQKVLDQTRFCPAGGFSRRAGGVFMLHYDGGQNDGGQNDGGQNDGGQRTEFARFRALWRLAVQMHAPGLEFSERCGKGGTHFEALKAAYGVQGSVRENGLAAQLPLAGPFVLRSGRTGRAAKPSRYKDEPVDRLTERKRITAEKGFTKERETGLVARFTPDDADDVQQWLWPRNMDPEDEGSRAHLFPFEGEKRWIGVVHADISGLGQKLRAFEADLAHDDAAPGKYLGFSKAVERVIEKAVKAACHEVLRHKLEDGIVPARPILLGGDDVTIIVRGDLAVPWAKTFLETLEKYSQDADELEGALTACAGIAFVKANQPFSMAAELAEDLCGYAKKVVKAGLDASNTPASALAFHRVTTSLIGAYEDIIRDELTTRDELTKRHGPDDYVVTRQPYRVGSISKDGVPQIDDLLKLKDLLDGENYSVGPLRHLRELMFVSLADAKKGYSRWREVTKDRKRQGTLKKQDTLKKFDDALKKVVADNNPADDLPFGADKKTSPLFDALELREVA